MPGAIGRALVVAAVMIFSSTANAQTTEGDLVASFDFGAASGGSDRGPANGEPKNDNGLQIPGQVGDWVELQQNTTTGIAGGINVDDNQSGNPINFAFGVNGEAYEHNGTGTTPTDSPKDDFWRIRPGNTDHTDVAWEITGLNPAATYDLVFFGGADLNRPTAISIAGNTPAVDADGDANFLGIQPDNTGKISGLFVLPAGPNDIRTLAGLQIACIAPALPSSSAAGLAALMLTFVGLMSWRLRRASASAT